MFKLINMCLGMFFFGSTVYGTLWVSWTWMALSFPMLGKFLTIISNIYSYPFFFSSSGISITQMLVHLMLSQRSLRLSSFLFILFSLFFYASVISTILSSISLIHFSTSVILLPVPSSIFVIPITVLFIADHLFFICPLSPD